MSKSKIKFDKVTDNSVGFSWNAPTELSSPVKKYIVERSLYNSDNKWEKV